MTDTQRECPECGYEVEAFEEGPCPRCKHFAEEHRVLLTHVVPHVPHPAPAPPEPPAAAPPSPVLAEAPAEEPYGAAPVMRPLSSAPGRPAMGLPDDTVPLVYSPSNPNSAVLGNALGSSQNNFPYWFFFIWVAGIIISLFSRRRGYYGNNKNPGGCVFSFGPRF